MNCLICAKLGTEGVYLNQILFLLQITCSPKHRIIKKCTPLSKLKLATHIIEVSGQPEDQPWGVCVCIRREVSKGEVPSSLPFVSVSSF